MVREKKEFAHLQDLVIEQLTVGLQVRSLYNFTTVGFVKPSVQADSLKGKGNYILSPAAPRTLYHMSPAAPRTLYSMIRAAPHTLYHMSPAAPRRLYDMSPAAPRTLYHMSPAAPRAPGPSGLGLSGVLWGTFLVFPSLFMHILKRLGADPRRAWYVKRRSLRTCRIL